MDNFWNTQSNFTLISLITFEVVNENSPNLQSSCRNTSLWSLRNYMGNGWELTSELTSKWITFKNTKSNFTLISLITFEVLNQTSPHLQESCRDTSQRSFVLALVLLGNPNKYVYTIPAKLHGKRLRINIWIDVQMNNFWNTQSNFTLISLITFEVLNQTSPNLQECCRGTGRWCLQNYIENGGELTSELTSKWITFEILNQISH